MDFFGLKYIFLFISNCRLLVYNLKKSLEFPYTASNKQINVNKKKEKVKLLSKKHIQFFQMITYIKIVTSVMDRSNREYNLSEERV